MAEKGTVTPAPKRNDRLDQGLPSHPAVESGALSLWIESSDISYNIRRFYTMRVVDTGFTKARSLFIRNGGMLRTSKAIRLGSIRARCMP